MDQHVLEGVTYEIVDVVDANYARLANAEDDEVEYLELDMEVIEGTSDAAEYFSTCEDSQDDPQSEKIEEQPRKSIQVNGGLTKRKTNGNLRSSSEGLADAAKDRSEKSRKKECDSLDLFFQSMAQTVLHLPPQVQAKIKMEICKVISRAEIKYCSNGTDGKSD